MTDYIIQGSFLLFVILATVSVIFHTIYNGISPMPTSRKVKRLMLKTCKERSAPGTIIELGSGWGSLAFPLASAFTETQIIGYENSPVPYMFSRLRQCFQRRANLHFKYKNFYTVSLKDAGMVVCYLYPGGMQKLREKFERELPPGSCIMSNTFAVPGWQPEKTVVADDLYKSKVYFYRLQQPER
jgi:hypothetical protein